MLRLTDFLGTFTRKFKRRRLKYPTEIRIIEVSGSAGLTDEEIELFYHGTKTDPSDCCPDCYNQKFYAGPRGGGSQNYRCTLCGMGYNLSGGVFDERIGLPDHIWTDQIKVRRKLLRDLLGGQGFQTSDKNWGIEKDGHHGIWIWPHNTFATIPSDLMTVQILTWDSRRKDSTELWKRHSVQLPDPDFIKKIDEALRSET